MLRKQIGMHTRLKSELRVEWERVMKIQIGDGEKKSITRKVHWQAEEVEIRAASGMEEAEENV